MRVPVLNLELVLEAYFEGPEPLPRNIMKAGGWDPFWKRRFELRDQVHGYALAYVELMRPTPGA